MEAEKDDAVIRKFVAIIRSYGCLTELTPEIMHGLIESIQINARSSSPAVTENRWLSSASATMFSKNHQSLTEEIMI